MAVTKILAGKNGPYRMEGGTVVAVDAGGNEVVVERPRISLCRCGNSNAKPFCDGTHKTRGFVADVMVVRWSPEP